MLLLDEPLISLDPRHQSDTVELVRSLRRELGVTVLLEAWFGITLAFYTDWPSSFWITALSAIVYLLAALPRLVGGQPSAALS